jgi:predicted dehydrogenase
MTCGGRAEIIQSRGEDSQDKENAMRSVIGRRGFLRRAGAACAAAAGAPYVLTSSALGAGAIPPPSDRITLGFVGVGSHGTGVNLRGFLGQPDAQAVAVCDVDADRAARAKAMVERAYADRARDGLHQGCEAVGDWRRIAARADIDAVVISTPDHWHVPISLAAVRAGKDVICEKPTMTVAEGRALADAVGRRRAVFQMSTEDRAVPVYHRLAELVRNGRIGRLRRIRVKLPAGPGRPCDAAVRPLPAGLDYDMWLGPAPWRPYRPGCVHYHFRWVRDFSGGQLTDWGAHLIDTAQWANDTERTGPVEVAGEGKAHAQGAYDTYHTYRLRYRYADGVEMFVESGGVAIRFEGDDGWVGNNGWRGRLEASSPEILRGEIGPDDLHLYTCPGGEHRNFLDCVKSRRDPYFPAEIGHRCCSVMHIGNIAMDLGRTLRWDPRAEQFPGDSEANRRLSRALREPWTL